MTTIRVLVPHPHVRVETDVLGGSPYIVGSRVPVRRVWAFYSRGGATVEQLIKRYPHVSKSAIFDALSFAIDNYELIEADLAHEDAAIRAAQDKKLGA
jgi:uncharacterized protein (DUF433 family)